MRRRYAARLHAATRLVRGVPATWTPALRMLVQLPLWLVAVLYVLVAWVFVTVAIVLRAVGGEASGGGSPSGPETPR